MSFLNISIWQMQYDEIHRRCFLNSFKVDRWWVDFEIWDDFLIDCFNDLCETKISSIIRIRLSFSEHLLEKTIKHLHHVCAFECFERTVIDDNIVEFQEVSKHVIVNMLIAIVVYDVRCSIHTDEKTKRSNNVFHIDRSACKWNHESTEIADDV
jgi:hypothetical protein